MNRKILIIVGGVILLVVFVLMGKWFVDNMCLMDCELTPEGVSQQEKDLLKEGINDPFVRHVRSAINNYNASSTDGYSNIDFGLYGEYLNSKFILMGINHNAVSGGKDMHIVFTDKPDKLFYVWVYDQGDGSLDMRAFSPDERMTAEEVSTAYDSSKLLIEELSLAI